MFLYVLPLCAYMMTILQWSMVLSVPAALMFYWPTSAALWNVTTVTLDTESSQRKYLGLLWSVTWALNTSALRVAAVWACLLGYYLLKIRWKTLMCTASVASWLVSMAAGLHLMLLTIIAVRLWVCASICTCVHAGVCRGDELHVCLPQQRKK